MEKISAFSYSRILFDVLHSSSESGQSDDDSTPIEPLAYLKYSDELEAKNAALREFWKTNRLHGRPGEILASPRPRHYRTTTKRRVFFTHGKYRLRFSHHKEADSKTIMLCSALEPREHDEIYSFLAEKINTPGFSVTAKHLTYIIIRGTYSEFCVIFNVGLVNGQIVRNLKALAENLKKLNVNITSSFVFSDPTRSDYYLDNKQSGGAWKIKNLFGPDTLKLTLHDQTYRFDPVSFSQVNQSMLPVMLDVVKRFCGPCAEKRFIDLYCGYGLFANYVGKHHAEVYGIDSDSASVERGRDTARFTAKKFGLSTRMYFRTAPITVSSLSELLPVSGTCDETILLDPPRQGAGKGVIDFCAQREPSSIIHIFCNIDRIPEDLQEWQRYGFRVGEVVALDMFPGTPGLEVMVLLKPF
ncbi:MAG TPA: class I SAM-dependent RNA methyltransferase [Fibrobacteres bacterium]|jgi:tRNA/tmRNA/rRNA uracil-C5-methylase (TrmA/RlmC/RlmD family)|nr:class I SAM-dependent RNA methyltransferase [Fibrobacterota bacterium]